MFAQIDTKTVYSFMDSLVDLESYIQRAKALGYQSIGIMDKDNLYGAYHFIKNCQKHGLQPILGLEIDYPINGGNHPIYLIALNNAGYKSLLKISSAKMSARFVPSELVNYCQNLAVIIPYEDGQGDLDLPFDYFLGIYETTDIPVTKRQLIPLRQVRYFEEEDREALQILHAIRDNLNLNETAVVEADHFLENCQVMTQRFQEKAPQALETLENVLASIDYQFDSKLKLPRFNREKKAHLELCQLTEAGLKQRQLWLPVYQERLKQELAIISEMGFDDYFLIVWDLLRFGRSKGYYMGMGRGSAAGSLVAYALQITGIDPVKNNLLFERFLNKERYSMPDIDIDLPDIYRSEFLHYVRDRYGRDHSAQIVTFSTFGPKQAIRDVFKRYGVPEYEISHFSKKIGFKDTLTSVYEKNISFRQAINSKLEYQKAFEMARRIEGNPRQTSIHAAGIVMSDDNLTDHIPLKQGEDMMITQYDAAAVEANGLLKMDFLGLRNLTFVQKMKEKVAKEFGQDILIEDINLEDKKTLALFARGDTKGIFQFEQNGAISLLKRIKPVKFEEIVATTSLNRPGASDYTNNFIKRRMGQEKIDLIDPVIAPILEPTYGIMLYQEQVMQIAQVFAGFTLGKADLLRRAMSKKDANEMSKMEADFLEGASKLGRSPETAKVLFKRMEKFAGYGFNRSHAFAYSALAFQLAYFKAHYPSVFFDVIMNYSNADYITDALDSDFRVVPLSINTIPYTDKVENGTILMGMKNIKGIPRDLAYWIIEARPFTSIENFLMQLPEKYQKKDFLTPLISIGLFDCFEKNRRKVLENSDALVTFVNELGSLFADSSFAWVEADDFTNSEKYQMERDYIGVGLSKHPLVEMMQNFKGDFTSISKVVKDSDVHLLVQIETIRVIRTKSNGQQMAFMTVTDTKKKMDVTLFPEQFIRFKELLIEGEMYYIGGRVKERDGRLQLILNSMSAINLKKYWILLENHEHDQAVAEIIDQFPGDVPILIHYQETKETLQVQNKSVEVSSQLEQALKEFVVKTVYQ
ncbi:DNA polymerase III subunit alpha [Streptococcus iniae]|uniref:DNA polymerase III subunit alpha n=1 Tax=Streptococcus iniae TaxID=1346 RepID=A0A3L8GHI4_STRIN|nr:DNA polymerase III subunit alpha [Streptococcus iniae]AGM98711.1 DNA polymerase III subunit alpha [Streptococcus iniae SF1]AHY15675.1 DNA polymerase III DnaE [Streptococcus iniae]AHY17543.1 DNA polymerase III DnaE [Streptococcus iniae]AJG25845.1 DNA polymerase III DnaE [Streptococcus iniae]APD31717.1 DNA polymerase III subunit alpha [Streptococcus iniae]